MTLKAKAAWTLEYAAERAAFREIEAWLTHHLLDAGDRIGLRKYEHPGEKRKNPDGGEEVDMVNEDQSKWIELTWDPSEKVPQEAKQ